MFIQLKMAALLLYGNFLLRISVSETAWPSFTSRFSLFLCSKSSGITMDTSSEDYANTSSRSKMITFQLDHVWKIDNFKSFLSKETEQFSPKFFNADHDMMFSLMIKRPKKSKTKVNAIELYLYCYPGKMIKGGIPITFELAFLKNDGSCFKQPAITYIFNDTRSYSGYDIFEDYSRIMNPSGHFLHDNHQLQVSCKATVNYNKILNHLSLDLISLFDSGDFSDIDIVVDGTKIPAHKCILSARSPIFKAMFSYNNTKEALEKEVVIPDVSVNVMKEFLRFIYTGVKPKESPYFLELLTIADMYQVDDLKFYCQDQLSNSLEVENVVDIYLVADFHNAVLLKEKCLFFIASHFQKVVFTKDWEQMCKSHGKKMIEVCRFLGNSLTYSLNL